MLPINGMFPLKPSGGSGGTGGSGESNVLIVPLNTTDGQNFTIDKSYQEINEAYQNNKLIYLTFSGSFLPIKGPVYTEDNVTGIEFQGFTILDTMLITMNFVISNDESVSFSNVMYQLTILEM